MEPTQARDAVLNDYARNLIRRKASQLTRQRGFAGHEAEDIESRLRISLLEALDSYDPKRGHLYPFMKATIENAVAMIVRGQKRQKRGGGERPASLDTPVSNSLDSATTLGNMLTPLDAARKLGLLPPGPDRNERVAAAIAALPPSLRQIAHGLKEGTPSSVARDNAMSRRQVRNAIVEIRRRFEQADIELPEQ